MDKEGNQRKPKMLWTTLYDASQAIHKCRTFCGYSRVLHSQDRAQSVIIHHAEMQCINRRSHNLVCIMCRASLSVALSHCAAHLTAATDVTQWLLCSDNRRSMFIQHSSLKLKQITVLFISASVLWRLRAANNTEWLEYYKQYLFITNYVYGFTYKLCL